MSVVGIMVAEMVEGWRCFESVASKKSRRTLECFVCETRRC